MLMGNRIVKTTVCRDCVYKVDGEDNKTGCMWCKRHNDVCKCAVKICEYSNYTYDTEKFEEYDREREVEE